MKARIVLCTNEKNKKIPCIKFYRWLTGGGLKDSKDFIEQLEYQFGSQPAEFTVETNFTRQEIEAYMDECKLGGSALVSDGVEGKFYGVENGVIHVALSYNESKMEMDIPVGNLGTMIDSFIANAIVAKEQLDEAE